MPSLALGSTPARIADERKLNKKFAVGFANGGAGNDAVCYNGLGEPKVA
jgi:hypothetical protein